MISFISSSSSSPSFDSESDAGDFSERDAKSLRRSCRNFPVFISLVRFWDGMMDLGFVLCLLFLVGMMIVWPFFFFFSHGFFLPKSVLTIGLPRVGVCGWERK